MLANSTVRHGLKEMILFLKSPARYCNRLERDAEANTLRNEATADNLALKNIKLMQEIHRCGKTMPAPENPSAVLPHRCKRSRPDRGKLPPAR